MGAATCWWRLISSIWLKNEPHKSSSETKKSLAFVRHWNSGLITEPMWELLLFSFIFGEIVFLGLDKSNHFGVLNSSGSFFY